MFDPENEELVRAARRRLTEIGFDAGLAEALAENGYGPPDCEHLTVEEGMRLYLEWNGVIGYAGRVIAVLDNLREMGSD